MKKICKNCIHFEGYDIFADDYTCFKTNKNCTPNDTYKLFKKKKRFQNE